MAIEIIVTNAGRAALVNAANTGTNAVTITQLGITAAVFVPNVGQVALPGEIKRIASVAGLVVADDAIHITASDTTTDAYTMRGFGLYLNDGTLFAIYGQAGAILNKTAESMMLLAADIAFADIDAEMIEFGDTNFILPLATTEIAGLVELATTAEGQAGTDAQRALTPIVGKQSVLGWLLSQDGAGSGLDADMLDGLHAAAFALAGHNHNINSLVGYGTMASQNAIAVAITGGAIDGTAIGGTTAAAGRFTSVLATGGASGFGVAAPKGRVQISSAAAAASPTAGVVGNSVGLFLTNSDPNYGLAFGVSGTGASWLQGQRSDADGALYNLALNPLGGNVGIGTATPAHRLDIKGASLSIESASNLNGYVRIANSLRGWSLGMLGAVGWERFSIYDLTADAERVTVAPGGNVGIGTSTPQKKLSVSNGGANGLEVEPSEGDYTRVLSFNRNTFSYTPLMLEGEHIRLLTGAGVEAVRVTTTGNLGIGTNAPGHRLTVAGAGGTATLNLLESGVRSWAIRAGGAASNIFDIADLTAGATRFSINQNGAIVINGANPNYVFNVGASNPTRGIIADIANWAGAGLNGSLLSFTQNGINNWCIGQTPGVDAFSIYRGRNGATDGTEIMRLTSAGATILGNTLWHAGNDGAGSGLDADLLDGQQGAYYLPAASYTAADVLAKLLGVDGTGSGLDADTVDGLHAAALVKYTDFTGSNQSFGSSGYQKLPGGLIIQWGTYFVGANTSVSATFPIAFPNACLFATTSGGRVDTAAQDNNPFVSGVSQYSATIYASTDVSTSGGWIAIGY